MNGWMLEANKKNKYLHLVTAFQRFQGEPIVHSLVSFSLPLRVLCPGDFQVNIHAHTQRMNIYHYLSSGEIIGGFHILFL